MARKRMIDPDIWNDEDHGSMCDSARILHIACFSNADDEGRLTGSAAALKKIAFGFRDDITVPQTEALLDEVESAMRSFQRYEVGGKRYIQFKNWNKYQRVDHPTSSIIPPFTEASPNAHRVVPERSPSIPSQLDSKLVNELVSESARESSIDSPEPEHELLRSPIAMAWRREVLNSANIRTYEHKQVLPLIKQVKEHKLYPLEADIEIMARWIRVWLEQRTSTKAPKFVFFLQDALAAMDTTGAQV